MDAQQVAYAARRTIEGAPSRTIGDELGVHHSTVLRALSKDDIRQRIEEEGRKLIDSALGDACENRRIIVQATRQALQGKTEDIPQILQDIPKEKLIEIGTKESAGLRQSVGIDAAHASSPLIVNIFNDNRTQVVAPILENVLAKYLPDHTQESAIEAQYEISEAD